MSGVAEGAACARKGRVVTTPDHQNYVWQKFREGLPSLILPASDDAIRSGLGRLIQAAGHELANPAANEWWQRIQVLIDVPLDEMSGEQRYDLSDLLWRLYTYLDGSPVLDP